MPHTPGRQRRGAAIPLVTIGLLVTASGLLSACSTEIETPDSNDPACATSLANLPPKVLDQDRREVPKAEPSVDAAWGDPAITLACGFGSVAPTTDDCLTVNGSDWVFVEKDGEFTFRSFGTAPSIEVVVPASYGRTNAAGALVDLVAVAKALPKNGRRCVG